MLYIARTLGLPCFQRYDSRTQSIGDKRGNHRDHLGDVEGIGKAAFVSFQGVKVYEHSDADGCHGTNWARKPARKYQELKKGE